MSFVIISVCIHLGNLSDSDGEKKTDDIFRVVEQKDRLSNGYICTEKNMYVDQMAGLHIYNTSSLQELPNVDDNIQ